MEFLMNPSIWLSFLTLIILEIILGIDNIVFIAILTNKLPTKKRYKAQIIGLSFALIMRLGFLSIISWMTNLTNPLFTFRGFSFFGRNIILLLGGMFLLFKATSELHERLENKKNNNNLNNRYTSFWAVIIQIVILDAVFSLDSIITAACMVNNIYIMMISVTIAMIIMIIASRSLIYFINQYPTVVVLCLSFLLMMGISLISEGFNFHVPKSYLYAAIGFSILIEIFNQIARRNFIKNQSSKSIRERTAEAILRLMGSKIQNENNKLNSNIVLHKEHFFDEERHMITGVLSLASRTTRSIMTPRNKITWLNCNKPIYKLRSIVMDTPHNMLPVCNGELDQLIGIARAKDLMSSKYNMENINIYAASNPAIVVLETLDVLNLLEELRRAKGSMVIVSNEFGVIQGIVTPLDVLEAIAGEFLDEDETPEIQLLENGWLAKGSIDLHSLQKALSTNTLASKQNNVASLAGLFLSQCDQMPIVGDFLILGKWKFVIKQMVEYRIETVWIEQIKFNKN